MQAQASFIPLRVVEVFIPGEAIAQGSMVTFVDPRTRRAVLKPDNARELNEWRRRVRGYAALEWSGPPTNRPVRLDADFRFARNKRTRAGVQTLSGRLPCNRSTPDRDKLLRAVQDALTGVVYVDDSRAICGETSKRWSDERGPGVFLRIEELDE